MKLVAVDHAIERRGKESADDRPHDRHPRVAPVARALALDRQDGMRQTRRQVAGRIDGVTRRSAERHAQRHDQHRNGEGSQCSHAHFGGVAVDRKGQDDEDQHERADDFADEVAAVVADSRNRAEGTQFGRRVRRGIVVVLIENVDQHGTHEAAQHLSHDIGDDQRPAEGPGSGQTQRHGRIEMRPRVGARNEDTQHDGQAPRQRDDHPAGILTLGFLQRRAGDNKMQI